VTTAPVDVAVVGGGPAGLAVAAMAARRGLSVTLLERGLLPHDKACGEGVMRPGLAVLARLGVLEELPATESGAIRGVRYVQEDGSSLEGALPGSGGLGIRRTALSSALLERPPVRRRGRPDRTTLRSHRRTAEAMVLETDAGELRARVLVAADGLHSPLRRAEGSRSRARRPAVRAAPALRAAPWTDRVEVHLSPGAEAYVTPCGPSRVGVAFLWSDGSSRSGRRSPRSWRGFPSSRGRLARAEPDSEPRGAGPFLQRARRVARALRAARRRGRLRRRHHRRGMSVALVCAEALAELPPGRRPGGGDVRAFRPYEATARREFRKYAWTASAVLALARRPRLRRGVVATLAHQPRAFEWLLARTVGDGRHGAVPADDSSIGRTSDSPSKPGQCLRCSSMNSVAIRTTSARVSVWRTAQPPMTSLVSVNGPSVTLILPFASRTRRPSLLGSRPPVSTSVPVLERLLHERAHGLQQAPAEGTRGRTRNSG
jgi:2-polyprenyl-6-methoxyphenol hydroxylase-like FAD-dependent oxidoreductase